MTGYEWDKGFEIEFVDIFEKKRLVSSEISRLNRSYGNMLQNAYRRHKNGQKLKKMKNYHTKKYIVFRNLIDRYNSKLINICIRKKIGVSFYNRLDKVYYRLKNTKKCRINPTRIFYPDMNNFTIKEYNMIKESIVKFLKVYRFNRQEHEDIVHNFYLLYAVYYSNKEIPIQSSIYSKVDNLNIDINKYLILRSVYRYKFLLKKGSLSSVNKEVEQYFNSITRLHTFDKNVCYLFDLDENILFRSNRMFNLVEDDLIKNY